MATITDRIMGKVTTTITVTNRIDQILAERGFIKADQIRSVTLQNILVDTGATRLCLPENIISELGLVLQGEVDLTLSGLKPRRFLDLRHNLLKQIFTN
jgi:hypothetical protein